MRSPICHLSSAISASPYLISPEKEQDLKEIIDDKKISIRFSDEPGFNIRVRKMQDEESHEIVLPIASLEYLWAFSHFFWVFTQEYQKAQRNKDDYIDVELVQGLKDAGEVLIWARNNLDYSGLETWPQNGSRPNAFSQGSEDEQVASELFLCAIAWIIHHEVAHIVLKHPLITMASSKQEEQDADLHATDWILKNLSNDAPEFKKRVLGITVAVLCIQSLEIDGVCLHNTHPAAYERIYYNLSRFKKEKDDLIEALCTVMLQYLFHGKNISVKEEGESFESILADLLYDISRLSKN